MEGAEKFLGISLAAEKEMIYIVVHRDKRNEIMSAIMRDVFRMVPPVVEESAYGIGATTWEVAKDVTMRYGMQGD